MRPDKETRFAEGFRRFADLLRPGRDAQKRARSTPATPNRVYREGEESL
jgi:hypothetical protein